MATQRQQSGNRGGNNNNGRPAEQSTKGKPPVHEIRIGRLRVSIWEQQGEQGAKWYSTTLTRSYKDGQNNWKTATSYGRDDLLVAGELLRQAFLWVARENGGAASNVNSGNGDNHDEGNGGGEY
jgi:hypothetical protein